MSFQFYEPALLADDPRFIPAGESCDCPASCEGLLCTRDKGHDGDHASHFVDDEMAARWPAEEVSGG